MSSVLAVFMLAFCFSVLPVQLVSAETVVMAPAVIQATQPGEVVGLHFILSMS